MCWWKFVIFHVEAMARSHFHLIVSTLDLGAPLVPRGRLPARGFVFDAERSATASWLATATSHSVAIRFSPSKKIPRVFGSWMFLGCFFLGGLEQSGVQAGFQEVKFWTFPGHNSAALNDMDHFDVASTGAWDIATRCIPQWARSLQSDFHQSKLHNCIKIFRLNDVLLASCGTVQWSWSFYGIEQKRFAVCGMRVLILHSACVLLVQCAYFKSTSF